MLELYNTTNRVRRIPKYRYNGVYILNPKSSVDIEEFAAKFFEPWRKVGVVVRVKAEQVKTKVSEDNASKAVEESNQVENKPDEVKGDNLIESEASEEIAQEFDKVVETASDDKEMEYTSEYLSELGLKELKEIATSLGLELGDARKKAVVIEAILNRKYS